MGERQQRRSVDRCRCLRLAAPPATHEGEQCPKRGACLCQLYCASAYRAGNGDRLQDAPHLAKSRAAEEIGRPAEAGTPAQDSDANVRNRQRLIVCRGYDENTVTLRLKPLDVISQRSRRDEDLVRPRDQVRNALMSSEQQPGTS
jgi:hypothetical protein